MTKVTKIFESFYNSKVGEKLANPRATVATAAAIATVSNVSKDAVNCAYYTMQSLHNDRIPEDQRKFVAALDLSNGILNVAIQLLMSFGIANMITGIFDDKLSKLKEFSIDPEYIKEQFNQLPKELQKKEGNFEEFSKNFINRQKGRKSFARMGFTVLTVNIAMQILTKRIITPLIATPMASVFKKKFEEAEAGKNDKKQNKEKVVAKA